MELVASQNASADEIVRPISTWHLQNAYPEIVATDVVGAIITDFRGTDTLIEIMVFGISALGLLTLMTLPVGREVLFGENMDELMQEVAKERFPDQEEEVINIDPTKRTREYYRRVTDKYQFENLSTPLTRSVAQIVLPFAFLLSFTQILYGGSAPGDGFTAGIVSGLAIASWYVVFGYFEARLRLRWLHAGRMIVAGLTIAFINAGLGLITGGAFFGNITFDGGQAPAGLHLTTSVVFELAIYLVVFGGVVSIMNAISHPRDLEEWGL
jgi:multisubunit Na+/H+ antiporter MnhB subunit